MVEKNDVKAVADKLMPFFDGQTFNFATAVIGEIRNRLYALAFKTPLNQNQEEESSSSNS